MPCGNYTNYPSFFLSHVPAGVDLSDVAAHTTVRDWLMHLLPPPLGPVVDLDADYAHL